MRRGQRSIGGCISSVVVILLIAGGFGFVLVRAHNGVTLSVEAHPTIIGDSCSGSLFIQSGPANQVTLGGIFPQFTQDSATNTIEITQCDDGLTLTVPPEANIQIDTSDAITVLGVSGTLKLSTNGSRIVLEQVTLEGQSKIEDNGGTIVFGGNIAQGSTPTISDNGGSIDMTLPASSSFHLDLTGILGPIASDFPSLANVAGDTNDVHVDIGSDPSATRLTLALNGTAVVMSQSA